MDVLEVLAQIVGLLIGVCVVAGLIWLGLLFTYWEFYVPEVSWVMLRGAIASVVLALTFLKFMEGVR